MNSMFAVAPISKLEARFGSDLRVCQYGKPDLGRIVKEKSLGMHAMGANVWNRIVTNKWIQVDPMQLRNHFQRRDPKLHSAISKVVGEDIIRDILYVKAWRGVPRKANLVMELLVVDVYRDELHLGDITFCDPARPIAPINRVYEMQTHKGLGLLNVLLENMRNYARVKGYRKLTLTAAHSDLVPLFKEHGFAVEDSIAGRMGLQAGMSIPMECDVNLT